MNGTTAERNKIKGEEGYIFVDDGGSGNLPVVFTHSFGGDVSHWANQLTHFRETRRAVALDFRGHGKSDASPNSHYTAEALANDIVAVVDGLDLDKFVLVGHSMGGSAAIAYADSHPQSCRRTCFGWNTWQNACRNIHASGNVTSIRRVSTGHG